MCPCCHPAQPHHQPLTCQPHCIATATLHHRHTSTTATPPITTTSIGRDAADTDIHTAVLSHRAESVFCFCTAQIGHPSLVLAE